jgi:ATP-dependent DNA ligase
VTLPFVAPIEPMLAKAATAIPDPAKHPGGLAFEPKWDGFRMIIFRDDEDVVLQSRGGEDLTYCFPEIATAALELLPPGLVIDGELVIAHDGRLWFEELTARIRPRKEAGGRKITELAAATPAICIAFDLLVVGGESRLPEAFAERRRRLVEILQSIGDPFHLTPITEDRAVAERWLQEFEGAGLDGVVAKPLASLYTPGLRTLTKIKHARTADVVVAGWREFKQPGPDGQPVVGSLLLGLHDEVGRLHHIGVASAFTMARRVELRTELSPVAIENDAVHPWLDPDPEVRAPGVVSRWSGGKDLSFHALSPELVCEVGYDQLEGNRLRHVAHFLRWRPDRTPQSCKYDQLDQPERYDVIDVLAARDGD